MSIDLTLTPLYRVHGQEIAALPGLLALAPPRKTARGREQDRLVLYLLLTGNATFSTAEYTKLAEDAGVLFYSTPGPLTSAMRAAANSINNTLLERNKSTSGRGQYAIGALALVALRDTQCTLLLSGPMHIFLLGQEARHIYEPGLSGKGLGISQTPPHYFTQTTIANNERILVAGKVPSAWESTLATPGNASLDATRRRLLTLTTEDLHCVLMQATEGTGAVSVLKTAVEPHPAPVDAPKAEPVHAPEPTPAPTEQGIPSEAAESTPEPVPAEEPAAHMVTPASFPSTTHTEHVTGPTQSRSATRPLSAADFPASIPRAKPKVEAAPTPQPESAPVAEVTEAATEPEVESQPEAVEEEGIAAPVRKRRRRALFEPHEPSPLTRKSAKVVLSGIEVSRQGARKFDEGMRKFLPRMLPGNEAGESQPLPDATALFMALIIPLIVVTIGMIFYYKFGRSQLYDNYETQAAIARNQAVSLADPVMQSEAWKEVLLNVDKAEAYRKTDNTRNLRSEANGHLDQLLGISRLNFKPAFSNGVGIQISRLAATETDLYLLNAENGEVLRAQNIPNRGYQIDTTFNCKPGQYGNYTVGQIKDILALPLMSMSNATVLGVDAKGNLLYCAPGQVPEARPLPAPSTNWGQITAITMDSGNLYVLDAPSSAVWVYNGKDGEFTDLPYFFFGAQIPDIKNAIDLIARGDDIYILHSGGTISRCSYSRLDVRPTVCTDMALVNPFPALRNTDLFAQANITQLIYTAPPDSTILLLGSTSQIVFRLTPTSFELRNQFVPATGVVPSGTVGAMTTSSNHVLYIAVGDQVYFTEEMP